MKVDMAIKEEFVLRFDVESGEIPLDLFIISANCVRQIATDISKCIFEQPPNVNIHIKTPRRGSFIDILNMIIDSKMIEAGIVLKILDTPEIRAFIKGLTGHDYTYYTDKIGVLLRNLIESFLRKKPKELDKVFEFDNAANLRQKFETSFKEKSKLYKKLEENKQIENIGFSNYSTYEINKKDFIEYAIDPNEDKSIIEYKLYENGKKYIRRILKVTKPVTDKESNGTWHFRDVNTNDIVHATMEDQDFREKFYYKGMFPLKKTEADDIMDVQIEYEEVDGKTKSNRIITVFKFNDEILEEPPKGLNIHQVTLDSNVGQTMLNFDDESKDKNV